MLFSIVLLLVHPICKLLFSKLPQDPCIEYIYYYPWKQLRSWKCVRNLNCPHPVETQHLPLTFLFFSSSSLSCKYEQSLTLSDFASFFTNTVGKAMIVGRQSWNFIDGERQKRNRHNSFVAYVKGRFRRAFSRSPLFLSKFPMSPLNHFIQTCWKPQLGPKA